MIILSLLKLKINLKNASSDYLEEVKNEKMKILENISDVEIIVDELNQLGENIIQDLDERMNRIETIIKIADKKIKSYSSAFQEDDDFNKFIQIDDNVIHEEDDFNTNRQLLNENKKNDEKENDEKEKVLKLFKEGCSPQEIAKKLNKGIGEVQLICNLKKR